MLFKIFYNNVSCASLLGVSVRANWYNCGIIDISDKPAKLEMLQVLALHGINAEFKRRIVVAGKRPYNVRLPAMPLLNLPSYATTDADLNRAAVYCSPHYRIMNYDITFVGNSMDIGNGKCNLFC